MKLHHNRFDFVRALAVCALGTVTFAAAGAAAQDGKVVSRTEFPSANTNIHAEDLYYLSDGLRIKAFLFRPAQQGVYPCIIYNHGGNPGFGVPTRERLANGLTGSLAASGYVVIASQFRQTDGSEGKDEFGGHDLDDVLNLIPLLEQQHLCDTTRIGMMGGSRGGMMTYLALTKTSRIRAAVVFNGLADLPLNSKSRDDMEEVYRQYIPGYLAHPEQSLKERSAVCWAAKMAPETPIFILQGSADWRVLPAESIEVAEALMKAKHPVRLTLFEGGSHGLPEFHDEVQRSVLNWFNDYLRDGKKWPSLEPHGK